MSHGRSRLIDARLRRDRTNACCRQSLPRWRFGRMLRAARLAPGRPHRLILAPTLIVRIPGRYW
jgi:hypothetical protein